MPLVFSRISFILVHTNKFSNSFRLAAVDGLVKCESWASNNDNLAEKSKSKWWENMNRFLGVKDKVTVEWPFPFVEDNLFVLTLRAGFEGYHVDVGGNHITSFPYRTVSSILQFVHVMLNFDCS